MDTTTTTRRPQRITLTAHCYLCGATKTITGNHHTWQRWKNDEVTADVAFRRLDPTDRLWLLSGLCPTCT